MGAMLWKSASAAVAGWGQRGDSKELELGGWDPPHLLMLPWERALLGVKQLNATGR